MKLYISYAPNGGPQNFMNRLTTSITAGRLAELEENPHLADIRLECIQNSQVDCKSKYVVRLDGIYHDSENTIGDTHLLNLPIRYAYHNSNGCIFQSEFDKKLTQLNFGKIDNSTVINNGASIKVFHSSTEDLRKSLRNNFKLRNRESSYIFAASRWRRHKRLFEIIKIFEMLDSKYNNVNLHIAGEIDIDSIEYKAIQNSPKKDKIKCLGNLSRDAMFEQYKNAICFIHLSWLDHCPNVVVEAMSHGIPVLCSNEGGTRELIEKTNLGKVCEIDKPYNFSLIELYNPPSANHFDAKIKLEEVLDGNIEWDLVDLQSISIGNVAKRYVEFLKECIA